MKQYVKDLDNALDIATLQNFLNWMIETVELCGEVDEPGKKVIDALTVYSQCKKDDQPEQQTLINA